MDLKGAQGGPGDLSSVRGRLPAVAGRCADLRGSGPRLQPRLLRPRTLPEGYHCPRQVGLIFWMAKRAVSSAVEHCFHTAGVTGSSPVPPTIPAVSITRRLVLYDVQSPCDPTKRSGLSTLRVR
jgi:hypothetical protein